MQILQLHDLMQDNCLLSFFPPFFFFFFFFFFGGGGVRHISFANTFIIYSALLVLPGVSCSHNNM